MAGRDRNTKPEIARSEQAIQNWSFDEEFKVTAVENLGFDGQSLQRALADGLATKVQAGTDVVYVGLAAPGTAQSAALWQAMKIDTSSGVVVTYADGNANFDNVATDLSALTYN